MQSFPHKGQLTTWKDDRGFGFIKPDDGGQEVFLHISVLKGASRRPVVGDIIFYEKTTEANGKIRASKASIQGVIKQSTVSKQRSLNSSQNPNQRSQSHPIKNIQINKRNIRNAMRKALPTIFLIGLGISLITTVINFGRNQFLPKQTSSSPATINSTSTTALNQNCNIKGNISVSTGSKLYHLPNMQDYTITNIDVSKGEKWFCTEAEAIASGWKKAPR